VGTKILDTKIKRVKFNQKKTRGNTGGKNEAAGVGAGI
jgi:hypothetical protein